MSDPLDPCNGRAFREAHAGPYYDRHGRQLAAGERPYGIPAAEASGPMPAPNLDQRLDRPKRPCACCGQRFRPTARRRMLCQGCFSRAGETPFEPV